MEPGTRGKLSERSEFLPRRFRTPSTGVVSAAGLPFLLVLFFGQAKKRTPPGRGSMAFWWGWSVRGGVPGLEGGKIRLIGCRGLEGRGLGCRGLGCRGACGALFVFWWDGFAGTARFYRK